MFSPVASPRRLLLCGLCLAPLAIPVQAQTSAQAIELAPLTVIARPEALGSASARDFHRARPMDTAEILSAKLPQIALVRRGPLAGDLLLRGLGRDNLSITLDNLRVCGACPNRMDPPAFHTSTPDIQSITVRPGPFDVSEEATPGGSIQMHTQRPSEKPFLHVSTFGDSGGHRAAGAAAGLGSETLSTRLNLHHQHAHVYKDGSGTRLTELATLPAAARYQSPYTAGRAFSKSDFASRTQWRLAPQTQLEILAAHTQAENVLYPGLRMDALYDRSWRGGLRLHREEVYSPLLDSWKASFSASRVTHDMRDTYRQSSAAAPWNARGFMMKTRASTRFLQGDWQAEKALDTARLRYGLSARERRWDADNTIMNAHNDMLPDVRSTGMGLWTDWRQSFAESTLNAGLRLDLWRTRAREDLRFLQTARGTSTNAQSDVLPAAFVLVEHPLSESLQGFAGVGHARRLPDPQERYIHQDHPNATQPDWVGNPDLRPVASTEVQGGVQGRLQQFSWKATAFHSWLKDYIEPVSFSPAAGSTARNPSRTYEGMDATLFGWDLHASWDWDAAWTLEGGLAWVRGKKKRLPTGNTSSNMGEMPPLRGRTALIFTQAPFAATLEMLFADAQERVNTDLGELRASGYAVWNLRLDWQLSDSLGFGTGVDNVTDKQYTTHNGYTRDPFGSGIRLPEPGRLFFVRVDWRY